MEDISVDNVRTITVEFTIPEIMKLISICNTTIVAKEDTFRSLKDSDSINMKEGIRKDINTVLQIKNKVKKTINSLYGQSIIRGKLNEE